VKKHIYVYSPSGAVRDKAAFKRGVRRLQSLGHEVEVDADALSSHQRFAGDDETRLAAIHRAAASGADVDFPWWLRADPHTGRHSLQGSGQGY
jgi:muramoyltetrapeptide carboxypeptidase